MTAPTYVSGWCGNGMPWGHARCGIAKCTCDCHGINAVLAPRTEIERQFDALRDERLATTDPAPRTESIERHFDALTNVPNVPTPSQGTPPAQRKVDTDRKARRTEALGWDGVREVRFARSTGAMVVLYGGGAFVDDPDNPWTTVCDDHDQFVTHKTMPLARQHLSQPTGWCTECRKAQSKGEQ